METQTTKNLPTTVGKKGRVKMPPDGEVFTFTVVDELSRMQENSQNSKLLLLQQYLRQLRRWNLHINSMNTAQRGYLAENLLQ
jgi:hypothetical protein